MDLYPYALLLHILGAIGLFVALTLQWLAAIRMRGSTTRAELIGWMEVMRMPRVIAPTAMVVQLVSGLFMASSKWTMDTWAGAGLLGLIVLAAFGALLTGRTMIALGRILEHEPTGLSPNLREQATSPTLLLALWLQTGLAVGIVSVMTLKPDLVTSRHPRGRHCARWSGGDDGRWLAIDARGRRGGRARRDGRRDVGRGRRAVAPVEPKGRQAVEFRRPSGIAGAWPNGMAPDSGSGGSRFESWRASQLPRLGSSFPIRGGASP